MANSRESTDEDKKLPKRSELQNEVYNYNQPESGLNAPDSGRKYVTSAFSILVLLLFVVFIDYRLKQLSKKLDMIYNEINAASNLQRTPSQDIFQKGEQRGVEQGAEQGARKVAIRLLEQQLGDLSGTARQQIEQLKLEQIESLCEALLDFQTKDDLNRWLKQHAPAR